LECVLQLPNQDNEALKAASAKLPGLLTALARTCSLRSIREIAFSMSKCKANHSAAHVYALARAMIQTFVATLSNDERIVATHINTTWTYFDESLSWSMCKDIFHDDLVRWKVAFLGLVRAGWISFDTYLGYKPSYLASLVQPYIVSLSSEKLHSKYLLHFANEMCRVNLLAAQCPSACEYYGEFSGHFSDITAMIQVQTEAPAANSETSLATAITDLVVSAAGSSTAVAVAAVDTISLGVANIRSIRSLTAINANESSVPPNETLSRAKFNQSGESRRKVWFFGLKKRWFGLSSTKQEPVVEPRHEPTVEANNSSPSKIPEGIPATPEAKSKYKTKVSFQSLPLREIEDRSYLEEHKVYRRPLEISDYYRHVQRFVSPIDIIDANHSHFKTIKTSDNEKISVLRVLAGNLSNLWRYISTPHTGVSFISGMIDILRPIVSDDKMTEALIDMAELEFSIDDGRNAFITNQQYLKPAVARLEVQLMLTANQGRNSAGFKNNPYITASKIPSYAPRVMLAQGMALDAAGDLSGAKNSYSAAVVLFKRLGATEDTSPSYAAAVARLQKANSRLF
jgi:hypothetical protein